MKLENRTNKTIILEMMPKICELRSLGYRMPSIYKAFREEGLITCGLGHFKDNYYALKREIEASQSAASIKAAVSKSAIKPVTESSVVVKPTAVELNDDDGPESNEPEKEKTESGFIGAFDLERQRRLARLEFEKNRNRYR